MIVRRSFLRIAAVLFAWACWSWFAHTRQWFWLAISMVPYLVSNCLKIR